MTRMLATPAIFPEWHLLARTFHSIQHLPDPRQEVGARPRLRQEWQRRIERVLSPPATRVTAGKEKRRLSSFAAIDLIEPAAAQPAHHEIGEDQVDRRGVLAQQLQRLEPVRGGQDVVPGVLQRVHRRAAQLRLILHDEYRLLAASGRYGHLLM